MPVEFPQLTTSVNLLVELLGIPGGLCAGLFSRLKAFSIYTLLTQSPYSVALLI